MTKDYTGWRKSRHSDPNGECIELAHAADGTIGVRDSKDPNGPVLTFEPRAWSAFLGVLKSQGA